MSVFKNLGSQSYFLRLASRASAPNPKRAEEEGSGIGLREILTVRSKSPASFTGFVSKRKPEVVPSVSTTEKVPV